MPLRTPVLFLVFNRPETTRRVFEAIRLARPPRLYVAGDGPRPARDGEQEKVDEAQCIATAVDWDCEVQTLFRDRNLGCRRAVSGALDWFFEREPEGIVLEDDCLPSASFFPYCDELLARYRDDQRVMAISGNNFQRGRRRTDDSYYFSRYPHCWGWASWRRAWRLYDRDLALWPEFSRRGYLEDISSGNRLFVSYWTAIFNASRHDEVDSWAYRWTFSCWANGGLTCLPRSNLVTNIGFGDDATHTTRGSGRLDQLPLEDVAFPLTHPPFMVRDAQADRFTDRHNFGITYRKKITRAVRGYVSRSGPLRVFFARSQSTAS
jgi:hypothetical protein